VARFHPLKDEYLCCYFKSPETGLTPENVFVEVDGFGVPALIVAPNGPDAWQVNCLRPPGLDEGRHQVRIRTRQSARSNPVEFVMLDESGREVAGAQLTLPSEAPELCSVELYASGDRRIAADRGGSLVCYFRSGAESIGASDVTIQAGQIKVMAHTVSSLGNGTWQANILLSNTIKANTQVRLRLGTGQWSESLPIAEIVR
jgi:hypothetical protein